MTVVSECLEYIAEHQRDGDARSIQTLALVLIWADGLVNPETLSAADWDRIAAFRAHVPAVRSLFVNDVRDVHTLALVLWVHSTTTNANNKNPATANVCADISMALDRTWHTLAREPGEPNARFVDSLGLCGVLWTTHILQMMCAYAPPPAMDPTVDRYVASWRAVYAARPRDAIFFVFHLIMAHTWFGRYPLVDTQLEFFKPERRFVDQQLERSDVIGAVGVHAAIELYIVAAQLHRAPLAIPPDVYTSVADAWRQIRRRNNGGDNDPFLLHMATNLLFGAPPTPARRRRLVKKRRRSTGGGDGDDRQLTTVDPPPKTNGTRSSTSS